MRIDLLDPKSIADWVMVWPARHWPQMLFFRMVELGRFADSIDEAHALVLERLAVRKAERLRQKEPVHG